MTLYSLKQSTPSSDYVYTKFDSDINPQSTYTVSLSGRECSCPAGFRPTCRHRQMLPAFRRRDGINTNLFHDFEAGTWQSIQLETSE
jgi:hypothetical protein